MTERAMPQVVQQRGDEDTRRCPPRHVERPAEADRASARAVSITPRLWL
jgi:hypothetical protein